MDKQILTPYFLFFADETNTLYALLKDNRLRIVKKLDSFSGFSFDRKTAVGISFNGEKTALTQTSLEFDENPIQPFGMFFGYFYYPSLNENGKKIAMIQTDLLHPQNIGELCIYHFFRGKWRLFQKREALISPPFFAGEDAVFFIDSNRRLICIEKEQEQPLLENVRLFTVTSDGRRLAAVTEDKILIYNLETGQKLLSFTVSFVSALCFSKDKETLFFANFFDGKSHLYSLNIQEIRASLLTHHTNEISLIVS